MALPPETPSHLSNFLERLSRWSSTRRRFKRLGNGPHGLRIGHIDSLELFDLIPGSDVAAIFDIGANRGTWTVLARMYYPSAEIHAFEPLPQCHRLFEERTKGLSGVHLHKVGLSSIEGQLPVYVTDNLDSSSALSPLPQHEDEFGVKLERVATAAFTTLDQFLGEHQLEAPDLIKLDIQGYEVEALKGAENSLPKVKHIIIELSFSELYEGGCLAADVICFLAKFNFRLVAFAKRTATGTRLIQADALFSRT